MWKSRALACILLALSPLPARAEAPRVVASIQPLHSLVAAVMKGVGDPALVVTGLQSEHGFALKPSDARTIGSARMVVLVDESYETFLAKPLAALGDQAAVVALARLPDATILPARRGGVWENEHDHDDDHGHGRQAMDGHLWLDPDNARLLVTVVAEKLAQLDPPHAETYRANARQTETRLVELDAALKTRLAPVSSRPFVVFHDAYQYFEAHYGLTPAGTITVDPDQPPSARGLAALRERLKASEAACIFREPQFPAPVVERLAESTGARLGVLDPQGADIPPGPNHYFALMTRLAEGFSSCLSAK